MTWFNDVMALALTLPPAALTLLVFFSAWLEYVFPPYFGDSVMLLGFFLAGQGLVSPVNVFIAAVVGSVLGAVVAYLIGRRYGTAVFDWIARGRWAARFDIERLQEMLVERGETILLVNRFIPFVRNFMIYGAGAFRLRLAQSMLANAISATALVSTLMVFGLAAGGSWQELRHSFAVLYRSLGVGLALVIMVWLVLSWRQQRPRDEPTPSR